MPIWSSVRDRGARHVAHYRDVVVAGDPGLMRLRLAIRASATAAAAAVVLSGIATRVGQPSTVTILGAAIAMLGTVLLSDATLGAEKKTLALMPLVAGGTVLLGTMAAPNVWASTAAFCAVIFVAVYVRRYGPRESALGTIGFMGYFFSLYFSTSFRGSVVSIPWTEGAIIVATAIAYLVRFDIVRERPQQVLESTLRAFEARARIIFDDLAVLAEESDVTKRRRISRRLHRGTTRLNETALALEDQVGANRGAGVAEPVRSWVELIFDIELAVETLADAIRELSGAGVFEEGRRHLVGLAHALRQIVGRMRSPVAREEAMRRLYAANTAREPPLFDTWQTAMHTVHVLDTLDPWPPPTATGDRAQSLIGSGGPSITWVAGATRDRLSPTVRLAIQATVAGALSMFVGRQISSTRWFWAVIAAFVVFFRATTLGETLARAWQRTLGTVGGVVAGLIVAQLVGRDPHVALALIFVGLFGAYYFFRASYSWMIGFITTVLALIYTVLGRYSRELLYIRLVETLAGAIIGAVVAAFVFPAHSSVKLRALAGDLIRKAARSVADATAAGESAEDPAAGGRAAPRRRVSKTRDVDRALQALWQAAMPLMGRNMLVAVSPITQSADNASALVYSIRQLESSMSGDILAGEGPLISAAGRELADACIAVADALESGQRPIMHGPRELIGRLRQEELRSASGARNDPARWLERIDRIVTDLAHTSGGADPA